MKSFLISLLILTFFIPVKAQIYSFTKPERLPDNVNSNAEESMPLVTKDGNSLFFVRTMHSGNKGGKAGGQDIWLSKKGENENWGLADNIIPNLNNQRNNAVIGMDSTGNTLYLLDSYSESNNKINGIAKTTWKLNGYLEPVTIKLKGLDSKNSFVGFYMTEKEDVILVSMEASGSQGEEDLYVCVKDELGEWGSPINLGPTINTEGFEISPFLMDDGKTLIFASNGHDGFGGSDLFMSRRLYDNSWVLWSQPVNLGEVINSEGFDAYFCMTGENEVYFASNRNSATSDIYYCKMEELTQEDMRAEINPSKYKLTESELQDLMGMPVSRTIYFALDSYQLKPESKELLDFLIEKLRANPEYFIELIGHTDLEGTESYNLELSKRRASEVETYFHSRGISVGRIASTGVGERELLYANGTPEEMAKNRRVEIFITKERF